MNAMSRGNAIALLAGVIALVTIGVSHAMPQSNAVQTFGCFTGFRLGAHDNGRLPARKGL